MSSFWIIILIISIRSWFVSTGGTGSKDETGLFREVVGFKGKGEVAPLTPNGVVLLVPSEEADELEDFVGDTSLPLGGLPDRVDILRIGNIVRN